MRNWLLPALLACVLVAIAMPCCKRAAPPAPAGTAAMPPPPPGSGAGKWVWVPDATGESAPPSKSGPVGTWVIAAGVVELQPNGWGSVRRPLLYGAGFPITWEQEGAQVTLMSDGKPFLRGELGSRTGALIPDSDGLSSSPDWDRLPEALVRVWDNARADLEEAQRRQLEVARSVTTEAGAHSESASSNTGPRPSTGAGRP